MNSRDVLHPPRLDLKEKDISTLHYDVCVLSPMLSRFIFILQMAGSSPCYDIHYSQCPILTST